MVMNRLFLSLLVAGLSGAPAIAAETKGATPLERVEKGISVLQKQWYNAGSGLWDGWWNSANSVTVLAEFSVITGSKKYLPVLANTYSRNIGGQQYGGTVGGVRNVVDDIFGDAEHVVGRHTGGFLNDYYDDEGWWALAWVEAYDATGNKAYLKTAQNIFNDMTGGWSDYCGGGLYWNKSRKGKNAIPNELFLAVAAQLALRTSDARTRSLYVKWAQKEWLWFSHSGMINSQHLVNDRLDAQCKNDHKPEFTYNQGVIVGGLTTLWGLTRDPALLTEANAIATATIKNKTDKNLILHEPFEPNLSVDLQQFKGIFMRNLFQLYVASPQPLYASFLAANANSIWNHDRNSSDEFGPVWSGSSVKPTAATQTSADDALLAALVSNAASTAR
jgi:predicted alpha-1,6-mannanase (GH76 family)